jgi:CDP-diacylglycerol--serine O-phosphatidyltransferase
VPNRRLRRGVYMLPSVFTLGNMFCGYACIVYAMRGDFATAAPFIAFAMVLDMLDGLIARMAGASSAFGVELDSLADVISFGMAPALLAFTWAFALEPAPLRRVGWAAGFLFVTGAALRLARFNIQAAGATDKRYFAGLPSPAAAGVPAATVFAYPYPLDDYREAILALFVILVPAFLMVSTIRYRSLKTLDLRGRRSYRALLLVAIVLAAVSTHPQTTLAVMAYGYLLSGPIGWVVSRVQRRKHPTGIAGNVIVTRVPAPRALSTSIVPPFNSTFRFAIVSPRPVPVALVEK